MQLYKVHQQLVSRPLLDVASEVHRQLDRSAIQVPQGDVAITVGSRGIANLPAIIRACGDWLKSKGAKPFIVPAMGSHNGATAEGQRNMIESLGITEIAMDMPIRSSMEVVELAQVRAVQSSWIVIVTKPPGSGRQPNQAAHMFLWTSAKRLDQDDGRRHGQDPIGSNVSLCTDCHDEGYAARDGASRARYRQDSGWAGHPRRWL